MFLRFIRIGFNLCWIFMNFRSFPLFSFLILNTFSKTVHWNMSAVINRTRPLLWSTSIFNASQAVMRALCAVVVKERWMGSPFIEFTGWECRYSETDLPTLQAIWWRNSVSRAAKNKTPIENWKMYEIYTYLHKGKTSPEGTKWERKKAQIGFNISG